MASDPKWHVQALTEKIRTLVGAKIIYRPVYLDQGLDYGQEFNSFAVSYLLTSVLILDSFLLRPGGGEVQTKQWCSNEL